MTFSIFRIFDIPPADTFDLPLVTSPIPVTLILGVYLLFVLKLGKKFMEKREPYNVKYLMLAYNLVQIYFNAYIFSKAFYWIFVRKTYDLYCMETQPPDHPNKHVERMVCYAYFINKILDLMDTVFFVLRKKYNQISFLHVYHHVMMVITVYLISRFYGFGGHHNIAGILNTFVHIFMYFYYFISAMFPSLRGSIWWKAYITRIQIIQFVIILLHCLQVLLLNPSCPYPKILLYMNSVQATIMLYMFGGFYIQNYIKPKNEKRAD